jgi:hypothetical protein
MIEKIILKKSSVLDKMPTAEQLEYGEIALNYNAAHPFLSFKDSDGNITALNDYSDAIKKKLNITDFNTFKADNTKTLNALDRNVSQNGSEIQEVNGIVQNHTTAIAQKADKTDIDTINAKVDKKVSKTDIVQNTGQSTTSVMSQKAVSDVLSNVYTKAESDARYLRGDWELISEVSEYDTSKNKITVAENCDGYKELAVRRTNNNTLSNTNVYLEVNGYSISLQGLSSQKKDAVWHVVQDGNNLSVKFLSYNFVNTGHRFYYPSSTNEYYINCKIGGKVELHFYNLKTLHDGENIKVYGKR